MAELKRRGLVTAVVCSTPFEKLGRAQSKVFGVPDLPLLMIPHPLGGIDMAGVRARADKAIPQFLAVIKEGLK
jgi:hypothetical protein